MKIFLVVIGLIIFGQSQAQVSPNQPLVFNVQVTDTVSFPSFRPTILYVLSWDSAAPINGTQMIKVRTRLEQRRADEETVRISSDLVPKSAFEAIIAGRDKITGAITGINLVAFNLLLSEFKLKTP